MRRDADIERLPLEVFYWRDGFPQRPYRWSGRGISWEVGTRAWRAMQDAEREVERARSDRLVALEAEIEAEMVSA